MSYKISKKINWFKLKSFYQNHEKKLLLLFVALFFLVFYFSISYLPSGKENTLNLPLDQQIPFVPGFILVYVSTYLFIALPYFLIKEKNHLRKIALTYLTVMGFSFLVFLVFPVKMARPELVGTGFSESLVGWLYALDVEANNCFPSLHVALSLLSGLVCFRFDKKYWWVFIWAGLIVVSTLLVKQHYVLDVAGGLVLGGIGYWGLVKRLQNKELIGGQTTD